MTYAATVLADGPVAYWPLGEAASSSTAADLSGNAHNLSVTGTVTFGSTGLLPADSGTSISLNQTGENGLATGSSSSDFSLGPGDFTIEFWAATTSSAVMVVHSVVGIASYAGFVSGKAAIYTDSITTSGSTSVNDGNSHYIVLMRRSGSMRVYVDAVLDNTPGVDSGVFGATGAAWVGHYTAAVGYGLIGRVQDLAIYKGVGLSDARVLAHYQAGTVNTQATGYSLSASPSSVVVNNASTVTATLTGGTSLASTLTITLHDDHSGTIGGTIPIANGSTSGSTTVTPTVTGSHAISATHTGGGFSGGDGSTTITVSAAPTVTTILPSMLWGNAYSDSRTDNGSTYYGSSCFATLVVITTATGLSVVVHCTTTDFTYNGRIGLRVNGVDAGTIACSTLGDNTLAIDLTAQAGYVSGSNTVELIAGSQFFGSGGGGTFLKSVAWTGDTSPSIQTPSVQSGRVVVYGNSIETGAVATDGSSVAAYPTLGWTALLRKRLGNGAVLVEATGGRSLGNDVTSSGSATTFAAFLASQHAGNSGPHRYWIAIGTNDYAGDGSASTFGTRYGLLLDAPPYG